MTPEATALAERLVAVVLRLSDCPAWDEGHLRLLAEAVLGRKVWARWTGDGWAVMGAYDAFPLLGAHVVSMTHATPGQAYAAAIVAAIQEGEKPEERA